MSASTAAVACGNGGTAAAVLDILRAGGNAVDGAVAGFFAACVHEPVLASLGGGGFALCRMDGASPVLLDFFAHTPRTPRRARELDFESVTVDFGNAAQEFHIGLGAMAAPGAVRGMFALHRRFGRMPLAELAAPALDAIRRRPPLCPLQARILRVVEPIYMGRVSARRLFASLADPSRVVGEGESPDLAELGAFIDVLVHEGEDLFHRGEVASLVENLCRDRGGSLGRDDLARYDAEWRRPLAATFRDTRVWLNPPPAASGALLAFALALLEQRQVLANDVDSYLELAAVMDLTHEARLATLTRGERCPALDALLDAEHVADCLRRLEGFVGTWRGTTHLSVADASGNIVALSVSNGEGCGEVIPGTGIMFNNMLGEEDLNPGGFHRLPADVRMSSMMAPTLVEWRDGRQVVLGSGGSNRIRSAILQVLVQLVDRRRSLTDAVTAPRIHVEEDCLSVERGVGEAVLEALAGRWQRRNVFDQPNFYFGGVHGVVTGPGQLAGAGDPRRAGVFMSVKD